MIWPSPKPEPRAKKPRKGLKSGSGPERDSARMAFVGQHQCCVCLTNNLRQRSRTHADHIRTRGAGGVEAGNLWALCATHHDERHRVGLRSFEYQYNVKAKTWGQWFEAQFLLAQGVIGG